MRPSHIATTLEALIKAGQSVMIWGPPGVGKSQTVKQVADKMFGPTAKSKPTKKAAPYANGHFIDLRLPLRDAVDLMGIPKEVDGKTRWSPPDFLPYAGEGVLFFDELPQALTPVQNAASSIILPPHTLGHYTLPSGWAVVAAGNRETDRAGTNRMPSHLANRFTHLQYDVHFEDWKGWAYANDVDPSVIAFLGFRPALLHQFDPTKKAFPTPRSWEFVSCIMKQGVPDECFLETVAGTVGEDAAQQFTGFFRVFRSLPDYEDIVAHPVTALVPDNAAALYAVSTMITVRGEDKHATPIFKYMERLPKEFQVLIYRDLGQKNPSMAETRSYIQWTTTNQTILLNR